MQDSERQVHRMKNKSYLIIDLKSFYASCECVMRGLDPMTTDLVVADAERGHGTICLAVSPIAQGEGRAQPLPRLRDSFTLPLHHGDTTDAAVSQLRRRNLQHLSRLLLQERYFRLLRR